MTTNRDDLDDFLDVLRDALLMIVRWIERRKRRKLARRPRTQLHNG